MESTVIVMGGGGFVGRAVCDRLARAGHRVVVAGRRPVDPRAGHASVRLDLARDEHRRIVRTVGRLRPTAVVNAVGSIWGRTDEQMREATTLPVLRLLDALDALPARPRLVHLGTVLEYAPSGAPLGPDVADAPDSAYGRAKLAATRAVLDRARDDGLDAVVLRVANVLGAGIPEVSLPGRVCRSLCDGSGVVTLRPLRAHRDYVHVDDVADAVARAVAIPGRGLVLPIGRGEAVGVRSLVDLLVEVSGRAVRVVEDGPPGPVEHVRVDPGPARRALGWTAARPLRDAARELWSEWAGRAGLQPTSTAGDDRRGRVGPGADRNREVYP